ncbi:MAG: hypothetical protein IJV56_00635, partial [Neisseriaceae bacterium]|nr:hypothetical protein [Neisseriaceae bacterium]
GSAKENLEALEVPLTDEISKQVGTPKYATELANLKQTEEQQSTFADKAQEFAGEVFKAALGIQTAHADTMPLQRNLSPESLPSDHLPDSTERTAYRDISHGTPVQKTDLEKELENQSDKNGSGSLKDNARQAADEQEQRKVDEEQHRLAQKANKQNNGQAENQAQENHQNNQGDNKKPHTVEQKSDTIDGVSGGLKVSDNSATKNPQQNKSNKQNSQDDDWGLISIQKLNNDYALRKKLEAKIRRHDILKYNYNIEDESGNIYYPRTAEEKREYQQLHKDLPKMKAELKKAKGQVKEKGERFIGDYLAQDYLKYANCDSNKAWEQIRKDRNKFKGMNEQVRNAEHYLYAYDNVKSGEIGWTKMNVLTDGYSGVKAIANGYSYLRHGKLLFKNHDWRNSPTTWSENKSGHFGADDAKFENLGLRKSICKK